MKRQEENKGELFKEHVTTPQRQGRTSLSDELAYSGWLGAWRTAKNWVSYLRICPKGACVAFACLQVTQTAPCIFESIDFS
jgi:hypothetical protein